MNFDEIKKKMDAEAMENMAVPTNIKQLETSKIPIQAVRKSMRGEIVTQLLIIIAFFSFPSILEMDQLPKGIYYILQFITALITLLYLGKMTWFLNKTSSLSGSSRDSVIAFIHDLQITLEVYKTAVIAGSLLLPISMLTFMLGSKKAADGLFMKFITLNMSTSGLVTTIGGYIVVAAIIYFGTILWANKLYGTHLKNLKATLKEFEL